MQKNYKRQIRKLLVKGLQSLPISSKYLGSPKEYYPQSQDYWELYKNDPSVDITYTPFLAASNHSRELAKTIHQKINWQFTSQVKASNPETFVITIPQGRVLGEKASIVSHDWLTDCLPRLEILKQCLNNLEDIDRFLINRGLSKLKKLNLQMLGIPLEKLHFIDNNTHLEGANLIVPLILS